MAGSLAWAAGLFDGEGTVGLYGLYPTLKLSMCSQKGVEAFAKAVGVGHVYSREARNERTRPFWTWEVHSWKDCAQVCKALIPELVIKQEECQVLLEMAEKRGDKSKGSVYSEEEKQELSQVEARLKELKRGG